MKQEARSKKQGFTLAEVLITLAVIGVVAALAIPALLSTTNNAELKTKWKKTFSNFSNITNLIIQEQGGDLVNIFPGDQLGTEDLKNTYKNKLVINKDCNGTTAFGGTGTGASAEGCWHNINESKELNGTLHNINHDNPGLILNDGTLIYFKVYSTDCTYGTFQGCAWVWLDVNGFKKPNTFGKDIFAAYISKNKLIPIGALGIYNPDTTCVEGSTTPANNGFGCAAKYLYK